jgi:hypothetical protein
MKTPPSCNACRVDPVTPAPYINKAVTPVNSTPKPISQQPDDLTKYLHQMWKGVHYDQT